MWKRRNRAIGVAGAAITALVMALAGTAQASRPIPAAGDREPVTVKSEPSYVIKTVEGTFRPNQTREMWLACGVFDEDSKVIRTFALGSGPPDWGRRTRSPT